MYGHQDDKRDKLTELEELNVQADTLAKDFNYVHHKMDRTKLRTAITEDELWPVFMNGNKIVSNTKKKIITEAAEQTLHDYWIRKKGRYTHQSMKKIDWDVLSRLPRRLQLGDGSGFLNSLITRREPVLNYPNGDIEERINVHYAGSMVIQLKIL